MRESGSSAFRSFAHGDVGQLEERSRAVPAGELPAPVERGDGAEPL